MEINEIPPPSIVSILYPGKIAPPPPAALSIIFGNQNVKAVYFCPTCTFSTSDIIPYNLHRRTHEKQQSRFQCPTCPYYTKDKLRLKAHIKIFHLKAKFVVCNICGYPANGAEKLTYHQRISHREIETRKHPLPSQQTSTLA